MNDKKIAENFALGLDYGRKAVIIQFVASLTVSNSLERWLSWSKAHDWKSCNGLNPFGGSNPPLSAIKKQPPNRVVIFYIVDRGIEPFGFVEPARNPR